MSRLRPLPVLAVGAIALVALLVPVLPLPDPVQMDVPRRLSAASLAHPLGLDEVGRDVLSRLLWGARASLSVAFAAAALACLAGTALGLIGGFLRGAAELLTVRAVDVILCFPPLLLALLVVTLLGPGASTLVPVLALVYLPGFVRVAYAGVLQVRAQDYVEAVRVLGAGPGRIMLRTVLPNIGGPVLVQFSLAAASAVVLESGLSFLGLGVVPPTPSWGLMIGAARSTMAQAPVLLLWPCLALTLTILALNALCDALRDAVDPQGAAGLLRPRGYRPPPPEPAPGAPPALQVEGLTLEIATPVGPVHPVRDVSFAIAAGETVAVVGESGSGKSLTGLAVMGLLPPPVGVAGGSVRLAGQEMLGLPERALRRLRGRHVAMVFQDPLGSLNPAHRIGDQIAEALLAHQRISRRAARARAVALLRRVGIPDPERRAKAYPHELSGGMRQRAVIAIAVANDPAALIADEPTTALDVTIQAQILDLLAELQRERGMALVFVTHSLPVVAELADRVVVMYAGQVVEQGPVAEVFARPLHPYTAALLRSSPPEDGSLPEGIPGTVPLPHALPPGCAFAGRCGQASATCADRSPALEAAAHGRSTRCLRWRELEARLPAKEAAE